MTDEVPERLHGSLYAYNRLKCRCADCREANALYHRNRRHRYWSPKRLNHGLDSTYKNYRCRCPECSEAHRAVRLALVAA